jgi:phospholipid transport system substrate-binding protein
MKNISRRRIFAISAGALSLIAMGNARAAATPDAAPARIQAFYDVLLASMKRAKDLGIEGRFQKLAPTVHETFDMPTMTRVACGSAWRKMSAEQQQALVGAFERMTAATYANQFSDYSGQRFVVDPNTTARNADVIVHSQLMPANGDPVTFNYLMRQTGSDWKIEDIYLDGTISQLAVRRSEFSAILNSEGPDGLLSKLKSQGDGLLKGS